MYIVDVQFCVYKPVHIPVYNIKQFITCHVIVFMPLTNLRSPIAVHITRYTTLSGLILHNIPRHLTFELDHVRKCTCKVIFFIMLFIFCVHVHVHICGRRASLAVTRNKCVIDCGFGKYRTRLNTISLTAAPFRPRAYIGQCSVALAACSQ